MKLSDFTTGPEKVIDEAFRHPVMKIKPRAANPYPTLDDALKATISAIEYQVVNAVADQVRPILTDLLQLQELTDGEFEQADDPDAWESALDDQVENAIEDYVNTLSADWLANHTIGCGLHLKDGIEKFIMSMGREMYKQLTYDKTPAQIMSAAGVVKQQIEARLDTHNTAKEEPDMDTQNEERDAVIAKIAAHVGKDYDVMQVYEDLDLVSDDDENLAMGAAPRLGIDETDVEWLQMERLTHGEDTADVLSAALAEAVKGGAKKPVKKAAPAKPKAAAKKPAKAKAEPEDEAASSEGAVSAESLQKLKEACTFKDVDVAQAMGVSRATFNNWVNGKTAADLSADQYTALRSEVVTRLNALHEVLGELDGGEPEVVF